MINIYKYLTLNSKLNIYNKYKIKTYSATIIKDK